MSSLSKQETQEYKDEGMASVVKQKVKDFESFIGDWHEEAKLSYDMVAGRQWSEEDKAALEAQERVPVVFNRIAAFIRGICGMEVSNRQAVKYLPRELNDVQSNEVLNAASDWARDGCNAADEDSDAFRDVVICGLGCTETRLDYEEDPEGKVFIERRDPLRVGYDPSAVKKNIQDATWVYSYADYTRASFEAKWPDKVDEVFSTTFPNEGATNVEDDRLEAQYKGDSDTQSTTGDNVRVIQFQYYKTLPFYKVQDLNGQIQEVPAERFKVMRDFLEARGLRYVKFTKRQYRQCFIAGDVELEDVPLPADEFTLKFLTGIRDRNTGYFYGMVRDAIDPQKWSNKFFSLAIEILATNAKGGLFAEVDAFEDRDQAEEDYANPRKIIFTKPGALGGGKIQPRTPNSPPSALDSMMNFAVGSMPQIMGINMEFLGLADRAQAGILESQRKQAAITTLAEFFSSLSLYRRNQGRCMMNIILKYLSDGRMIRIVGQANAKYIPLIRKPGFEKFDVIVDEAPNAPDVKARTWDVLNNILPQMMKMGIPIPPEVLDYSPIPASLAEKWKSMLAQPKAEMSPEHQQMMQQMQEQMQKLMQENQQLKQDQSMKMMELQAEREAMMEKLAMQREESVAQLELKRQIAEMDAQIASAKLQSEQALKQEQAIADLQLKLQQMEADQSMKAAQMAQEYEDRENDTAEKEQESAFKSQMNALMAKVDKIISEEKKDPEPKDIKLNYKDGKLVDAVLIKDDGTQIKVKVGRNGQKGS